LQTAYGTYDAMTIEAIRALLNKIEVLEHQNLKLTDKVEASVSKEEYNTLLKKMQHIESIIGAEARR
jgi:hypothetical protein